MNEERGTHAREQAKNNAFTAVRLDEESPKVAALVAIAYALLDVADAIRERNEIEADR
jgi:hypothetical protein